MKSVLVTGATGFLGKSLVMRLAGEGQKVNALYRSEDKIRGWGHENIHFVKGNLGDIKSIDQAISKGVIHRNTGARQKSRLMARFNALN